MMGEIANIEDGSGQMVLNAQCDMALVLLGKPVEGTRLDQMVGIWSIAAGYITKIYKEKTRKGIG